MLYNNTIIIYIIIINIIVIIKMNTIELTFFFISKQDFGIYRFDESFLLLVCYFWCGNPTLLTHTNRA